MDKPANKFIAVTYQLYTDDSKEMVEEATVERPFQFITGMSLTLDAFEAELLKLVDDGTFATLAEKYGLSDSVILGK